MEFVNKTTPYLNIIFSDGYARRRHRTFLVRPRKIALLPLPNMTVVSVGDSDTLKVRNQQGQTITASINKTILNRFTDKDCLKLAFQYWSVV
jgi:endonuclease YncB( thermonuclease family)